MVFAILLVNKIFLATCDRNNVQLHHEIQVGSIVIQLLLNYVILDITISLRSGELDAPRIILNIVTCG